jgi:glutathione S-transferase
MSLTLYYHPLASFCWKALVALYENDTPFDPLIVDLGDASSRDKFAKVWPPAKFPVLRDNARDRTVAEATVVIEYLDAFHPGATRFIPNDPDLAWQGRMWDRVFDHYVHEPMQRIIGDRIRPEGK